LILIEITTIHSKNDKIEEKIKKKGAMVFNASGKKRRKIGHQKASFTLLDNFSSKIIFFPS